jgi:alkylation response protein AidB-like acyl-CoA dehydrogenase
LVASALSTAAEFLRDPLIARTAELSRDVLAPQADWVAEHGVPRSHLAALAEAGTLGLAAYAPAAPLSLDEVRRECAEILAAADGATWFVSAQHHYPAREVVASANHELRDRWLEGLLSGTIMSALAISHLRQEEPAVVATRSKGCWRLSGRIKWVTGWTLADVLMVGAATPDGDILFALVPWRPADFLGSVTRQLLWSLDAASTVAVDLRDEMVPESMVVSVTPRENWLTWDRLHNANVNPAVFGVIRATTAFLLSGQHGDNTFAELGNALAVRAAEIRAKAYCLQDEAAAAERVDERRALRASALALAHTSAAACAVATGASGLVKGSTVGRLVAETFFHTVQGQDQKARRAVARHLITGLV